MQLVRLSDFSDNFILENITNPSINRFKKQDALFVISIFKKSGLKYNTKTGLVSDNNGEIMRYSQKSDIPFYSDKKDVIEWELGGILCNACSRLQRGLDCR